MKKSQWAAAQGLTYEGGRPKDDDILTRRPISFWDRIKWLFLLAIFFLNNIDVFGFPRLYFHFYYGFDPALPRFAWP